MNDIKSKDKIITIRCKEHEIELIELLRKKLSKEYSLELNTSDVVKIALKDLLKSQK